MPEEKPIVGEESGTHARGRHEIGALRQLRAEDVMSRRLVMIDGASSVAEAVRRMRQEKVFSLIIDRRDPQDTWGIVTRPDVIRKVVIPGHDPDRVKVWEIMTKPIITVTPDLAVKFCLKVMDLARVRRAVVFDGKRMLGILSHQDVFAALRV